MTPRWKNQLWDAVVEAVREGATPRDVISELEDAWLEALDDQKKDAATEFKKLRGK